MLNSESPLLLFGLPGLLLVVTVYVTRPSSRTIGRALVAGGAVAGLNMVVDVVAHAEGWWRYPTVTTPYGPPLFYVATGLWYGMGVALIGWRLRRRFGDRALFGLLLFMGVYGPLRDELGAAVSGLIVFGSGPVPIVADAVSWMTLIGIGQAIMRRLPGPPDSGPLAR